MSGNDDFRDDDSRKAGTEIGARRIARRDFLKALAAASAAAPLAQILAPRPARAGALASDVFPDGVKAGDPRPLGGLLWTRVTPPADGGPVSVMWMVAEDAAFDRVVRGGIVSAEAEHDHTVKAHVRGVGPDRWYYYKFQALGAESATGRLRTAPPRSAQPDHLRYAFASCQQRNDSLYVAHRAIASEGVDFLMHLGDYIYASDGGTRSLTDYRNRYRLFHTNPLLQELQAAVPLVAMWDDGEFYNGVYRTDDPDRIAAAKRAWFEYMPVDPRIGGEAYRSFPWGRLARVCMIDTRTHRDSDILANVDTIVPGIRAQDTRIAPAYDMFEPGRTTLGAAQKRWLERQLVARRTTWRLVGNPTNMNPWKLTDLDPGPGGRGDEIRANEGVYISNDAWDDYGAERREILEYVVAKNLENVVFTSGHTHVYLASDLQPDFDDEASPVAAVDFVTGSLTADPDPRTLASEAILGALGNLVRNENLPYMKYLNFIEQGYAVVDVTPEELEVRYRFIDTFDPDAEPVTGARFRVVAGRPGLEVLPPD